MNVNPFKPKGYVFAHTRLRVNQLYRFLLTTSLSTWFYPWPYILRLNVAKFNQRQGLETMFSFYLLKHPHSIRVANLPVFRNLITLMRTMSNIHMIYHYTLLCSVAKSFLIHLWNLVAWNTSMVSGSKVLKSAGLLTGIRVFLDYSWKTAVHRFKSNAI